MKLCGFLTFATLCCAGPSLAAENVTLLFGGDPGDGPARACFVRHYDTAHLNTHPQQNVTDMKLFVDGFGDGDMGRQYILSMGVGFRTIDNEFQLSGGCSSTVDGQKVLDCGIECDGGEIDVRVRDAGSILVDIPFGARAEDPAALGDTDYSTASRAIFGPDDKVFRLDRVALEECLSLIWDEELRAELGAE